MPGGRRSREGDDAGRATMPGGRRSREGDAPAEPLLRQLGRSLALPLLTQDKW